MEARLMEYLVNSLWQVPLVALGGWAAVRLSRPGPRAQYRIWVGLLLLTALLPMGNLVPPQTGQARTAAFAVGAAAEPAPGLAARREIEPAQVEAEPVPALVTAPPVSQPATLTGPARLPVRSWQLGPRSTRVIARLYLGLVGLLLLRLLLSWRMARRLVMGSHAAALSATDAAVLEECCARLAVGRPEVRVSAAVWSPLVVGVARPVLLLPEGLLERTASGPGLTAVWWHELIHIQRRDYLANLLCRAWLLPVAYHPAARLIEQRVRRTRELICDALAADHMASRVSYARGLMELAEWMKLPAAAGIEGTAMLGDGALEERVMELLADKQTMSVGMRVLRGAAGVTAMGAVVIAASVLHVRPTLAQSPQAPLVASAATRLAPASQAQTTPEPASGEPHAAPAPGVASSGGFAHSSQGAAEPSVPESHPTAAQQQFDQTMLRLVSPEMQKRVQANVRSMQEQLQKNLGQWSGMSTAERQKAIADAAKLLNSPERQAQMQQLQKALARLGSQDSQKKLLTAIDQLNSPELQKKLANQLPRAQGFLNSPEFKKQIEQLNSPELQKRIAELNSPEFRQQAERMQKQLAELRGEDHAEAAQTPDVLEQELRQAKGEYADAQLELQIRQKQLQGAPDASPAAKQLMQNLQNAVAHDRMKAELLQQQLAQVNGGTLSGDQAPLPGAAANLPIRIQKAQSSVPDQQLLESAKDAKVFGQYERERLALQTLVNTYPHSQYAAEAKRMIAQSWDAEGTLALVQADEEYSAAGMSAKPLGPGITPPALTYQVNPEYTPEAKAAKLSGTVLVNVWVDEQGGVQHVRVVRGLPSGLDEKAIDAVRQYRFKPAMEDGKPVMVAINVEVNFHIF